MDVYGAYPFGAQDVDSSRMSEAVSVFFGALDYSPYHSLFDREPAGDKVSRRPEYDYFAFVVEAHRRKVEKRQAGLDAQKKATTAQSKD